MQKIYKGTAKVLQCIWCILHSDTCRSIHGQIQASRAVEYPVPGPRQNGEWHTQDEHKLCKYKHKGAWLTILPSGNVNHLVPGENSLALFFFAFLQLSLHCLILSVFVATVNWTVVMSATFIIWSQSERHWFVDLCDLYSCVISWCRCLSQSSSVMSPRFWFVNTAVDHQSNFKFCCKKNDRGLPTLGWTAAFIGSGERSISDNVGKVSVEGVIFLQKQSHLCGVGGN